jgi:hypothetical protein
MSRYRGSVVASDWAGRILSMVNCRRRCDGALQRPAAPECAPAFILTPPAIRPQVVWPAIRLSSRTAACDLLWPYIPRKRGTLPHALSLSVAPVGVRDPWTDIRLSSPPLLLRRLLRALLLPVRDVLRLRPGRRPDAAAGADACSDGSPDGKPPAGSAAGPANAAGPPALRRM